MKTSNQFQDTPVTLYHAVRLLSDSQCNSILSKQHDSSLPLSIQTALHEQPDLIRTLIQERMRDDILYRLKVVDDLLLRAKLTAKLEIVGGSALILHELSARVSHDIDVVSKLETSVKTLLAPYDINNNALSVSILPPAYEERLIPYGAYFTLTVHLVHPVDIFLLKLQRMDPKDSIDIEHLLKTFSTKEKKVALSTGEEMCKYMSPTFTNNFGYYKRFLK